jgi:T-complex protein 1 subunit eta
LKEGTEASQGRSQIISNINACQVKLFCRFTIWKEHIFQFDFHNQAIVDCVRTTLGPRGMDKLMVEAQGKATISNDGATIMKLLDVVHPAAKTLVDIAKSQDAEVGDGTTSVVILAGEFLKQMKPFVEEGVHSQIIIRGVRRATQLAVQCIKEIAVKVIEFSCSIKFPHAINLLVYLQPKKDDEAELRQLLEKCAATAMGSKLINQQKDFFSKMVVEAVLMLDDLLPLNMIGIKKVSGGALEVSGAFLFHLN